MKTENLHDPLLLVLENVFRQKPLWAVVGDLFLTASGLYYVPYYTFQYKGRIGGAAGAVIGGLTGGIAVALGDKQQASLALDEALKIRVRQYGLGLKDRMPENEWALSCPRQEIESLSLSRNMTTLTCRTRDGRSIELLLGRLDERRALVIREYLQSPTPVAAIADSLRYGFDLPYPAPARLVDLYSHAQAPSPAELEGIATNSNYLQNFYALLVLMKKRQVVSVCLALNRTNSPIRDAIRDLAKDTMREVMKFKERKTLYACIAFFLVFLVVSFLQRNIVAAAVFLGMLGFCMVALFWPRRRPALIARILSK